MKCCIGDIVKFKVGANEIQKGEVQFVEESCDEDILYINSFSGWAYKVKEKKIISRNNIKNRFNINKFCLSKRVGLHRGETSVSPQS